jgi:hypothetical protein
MCAKWQIILYGYFNGPKMAKNDQKNLEIVTYVVIEHTERQQFGEPCEENVNLIHFQSILHQTA